jgi:hypothetical protein
MRWITNNEAQSGQTQGFGFLIWAVEDTSEALLEAFGERVMPWTRISTDAVTSPASLVAAGMSTVPKFVRSDKAGRCVDNSGSGQGFVSGIFYNNGTTEGFPNNPRVPVGSASTAQRCEKICTSLGANCLGFSFHAAPRALLQKCEIVFANAGEFEARVYPTSASPNGFVFASTVSSGDDTKTIHEEAVDVVDATGKGWICFRKTSVSAPTLKRRPGKGISPRTTRPRDAPRMRSQR